MNFLTPDDLIHGGKGGVRRKSVCGGAILLPSSSIVSATSNTQLNTLKSKKERRRGSLSEPPIRRASLVQRFVFLEFLKQES